MDTKKIGVYKITSPSGKIYIGQSRNIDNRIKDYEKGNCKAQIRLFNSFLKYGFSNHKFEIVEFCEVKDLNIKERFYQDLFEVIGSNGLNCRLQNIEDNPGVCSEITRQKISKALLGKPSGAKGKKRSEESKKKNASAHLGILSPQKGKTYEELFGKEKADEIKRKKSEAAKGKQAWNKDLTKETDERVKKNVEASSKSLKGRIVWNKGLTKETDERVLNNYK